MRYLDLLTDTFITRDPAGMIDGPNEYCYVRQNPWTSFDPDGLDFDGVDSANPFAFLSTNSEYRRGQTDSLAAIAAGGIIASALPEVTGASAIAITARLSAGGLTAIGAGNASNTVDNLQTGKPPLQNAAATTTFSAAVGVPLQGVGEAIGSVLSKAANLLNWEAKATTATTTPGADSLKTVSLFVFRGAGSKADIANFPSPLIYAGHVGYSFDRQNIFGLTPKLPEGMDPLDAINSLGQGASYPGSLNNDTDIFKFVANNTKPLISRDGLPQTVFQQDISVTSQQFDSIVNAHNSFLDGSTALPNYGFPPNCNCALFPGEMGMKSLEFPDASGSGMPKLQDNGQPWKPQTPPASQ